MSKVSVKNKIKKTLYPDGLDWKTCNEFLFIFYIPNFTPIYVNFHYKKNKTVTI